MTDPRIARLGELIVDYSLDLEAGTGPPHRRAAGGRAARRRALPRRAPARVRSRTSSVELERLPELLLAEGTDEQIDVRLADRSRTRSSGSTRSSRSGRSRTRARSPGSTRAAPAAASRRSAAAREPALGADRRRRDALVRRRSSRRSAHAQDAEMSLAEYEAFVFRACHVEEPGDPVAHWRGVRDELAARAPASSERARAADRRPGHRPPARRRGTALASPADGRLQHAGRRGLHEPARDRDRGRDPLHVPGDLPRARGRGRPAALRGRPRRRRPRRRAASDYLRRAARASTRARDVLGEVAFGLNYEIDRFTRNILFDEKIGGTMHLALGVGFRRPAARTRRGCTGT